MRSSLFVAFGLSLAACSGQASVGDAPGDTAQLATEDNTGIAANATVTPALGFCKGLGHAGNGTWDSDPQADGKGTVCTGQPIGSEQAYQIVVNARMTTTGVSGSGDVAKLTVNDWNNVAMKNETFTATLKASAVPGPGETVNLSLSFFHHAVTPFTVTLATQGNGAISVEDFEILPQSRQLVMGPGTKELAAPDLFTIETALGDNSLVLTANGNDVTAQLTSLISAGGFDQSGSFRRLRSIPLTQLVDVSAGPVIVNAHAANSEVAQFTLRATAPDCTWEGDPNGVKILLSGFEPFPVGTATANVSQVAVQALDPTQLPGVQVMRVTLPVEFDGAGDEIASIVQRCAPAAAISFGAEGAPNNLEVQAHNVQNSSGVDNRGILRVDHTIVPGGADTLPITLPSAAIIAALASQGGITNTDGLGGDSYVCNDVAYHLLHALAATGTPGGFIHLSTPAVYTPVETAQLGAYVQTIVATVAAQISGPAAQPQP